METEQKTILVTGGAGFVGSHLCEQLVMAGHRVISLDNYSTGSKDNHIDGVEYRTGHTKDIAELVPEQVDNLYHLGEYSRVAPSLQEPEVVWDLNVLGTLAVLEYWRQQQCRLIYAGSSTKFTDDGKDVAGRDRAPYNFAKAVNSELVHNYGAWYDLSYAVAYFYNVYGPRERGGQFDGRYGTVIQTFRECHEAGTPCQINGTGEQTRAFTHVLDTVNALELIAAGGENDEYPISAAEVHSLNQVADMFGLEKEYRDPTPSTRSTGSEDTSKLKALGWQQKHTLSEYIASIINV